MIETNHSTLQFIEPEHKDIQVAEHTQSGQVSWSHTDKTQLRNQENKSQKITKQFTTKLEKRKTTSQRLQSKIQATTRNPDIESQITWGDKPIAIEDRTLRL